MILTIYILRTPPALSFHSRKSLPSTAIRLLYKKREISYPVGRSVISQLGNDTSFHLPTHHRHPQSCRCLLDAYDHPHIPPCVRAKHRLPRHTHCAPLPHQPARDGELGVWHAHLGEQRVAQPEHGRDALSYAPAPTSPTSISRRTQAGASSAGSAPATSASRAREMSVACARDVKRDVRIASKNARPAEAAAEGLRVPETGWATHTSRDRPSVVVVQWLVDGAAEEKGI